MTGVTPKNEAPPQEKVEDNWPGGGVERASGMVTEEFPPFEEGPASRLEKAGRGVGRLP